MLPESSQQHILRVIQAEIDCTHGLLQSLELEYSTLMKRDVEAFEDAVHAKQDIIRQLERISAQREKLLRPYHLSTNDSRQGQAVPFDANSQLMALWDELVGIAEKCRDRNRVNGRIIELASKQAGHALDILHGIVPGSSSMNELYDNAGKTTKSINKRNLVKA